MPLAVQASDHAGQGVVPGVLLRGDARGVRVLRVGVGAHQVAGMAAAHAGGLHAARGGEIRGTEGEALHARRGGCRCPPRWRRPGGSRGSRGSSRGFVEPRLGLELRQQLVHVVDVPGAFDLGDHDDVELVADLRDEPRQIVEHPGAVQAVDAGPELAAAEVGAAWPIFTRPSRAASLFVTSMASSRLPSSTSHFFGQLRDLARPSSGCWDRRSGSCAPGERGSRAAAWGRRWPWVWKKSLGLRMGWVSSWLATRRASRRCTLALGGRVQAEVAEHALVEVLLDDGPRRCRWPSKMSTGQASSSFFATSASPATLASTSLRR